MDNVNIMVVGVGGQGTLLTSRVIGKTALSCGFNVKLSEVHGMAQRGGSVVTFVRFGDKIYEPTIEEGQADFIIAFEKLEGLRYQHYLKKGGKLIVNDSKILPMTVVTGIQTYPKNVIETLKTLHDVILVDGDNLANKIGNSKVLNTIILGVFARYSKIDKEKWLQTIRQVVPPKTVEINEKAFILGYEN